MNAKSKKERRHMNDLLLPILCVLCVMPFIVYLAEYDYGYGSYLWHSDNSVAQDLYAYYRSYFFELIAVISVVILVFRMTLYKEKRKPGRIFLPLAVYSLFAGLSTVFSVNIRASLTGNFYQFQSVFVLVGYCVMAFYAYQVMEHENDFKTVIKGISISFLLISVTGWFQVFGHDLLNYEWMQRLVMAEEQFAEYGGTLTDVFSGNNVFLTLYNPNYAAVFLLMFAAVFAVMAYGESEKKKKICYLVLLSTAVILLWFTYTRAALVAIAAAAAVFALCRRRELQKLWKYILPGFLLFIALLVGMDALNGFHYFSRISEGRKTGIIEEIRTEENGIYLACHGESIILSMNERGCFVQGEEGKKAELEQNSSGEYLLPFTERIPVAFTDENGEPSCLLEIDGYPLEFVKTQEGYFYRNEDGKLDKMTEIAHIDMGGMEALGSGRLYIWSRALPMLKDYLIAGSGPDTFAEVFPQNDYVGKMVYAESTRRVIESAHNDYLTRWVQTGMLSLASLLVFYVLLARRCLAYYRRCPLGTAKQRLGFGCFLGCICYLICCLFSDASLYTAPVFFIFVGIALAAAEQDR